MRKEGMSVGLLPHQGVVPLYLASVSPRRLRVLAHAGAVGLSPLQGARVAPPWPRR